MLDESSNNSVCQVGRLAAAKRLLARQPGPLLAQLMRHGQHDWARAAGPEIRVHVAAPVARDSALRRVFSGVQRFEKISVYVHGSWADDTRTEFSDLDDLIIIDDRGDLGVRYLRKLARWLDRVDMRFARLDPLQHHGHWVLLRSELDHLDESYIPLLVLEGALVVQGESVIHARRDERATQSGLARNIRETVNDARIRLAWYDARVANAYAMKQLIGSLLILPAYASQYSGILRSKREAIACVEEWSPSAGRHVMDWCTAIRGDWWKVTNSPRVRVLRTVAHVVRNPRVYRVIASRVAPQFLHRRFPRAPRSHIDRFLVDMDSLPSAGT